MGSKEDINKSLRTGGYTVLQKPQRMQPGGRISIVLKIKMIKLLVMYNV